MTMDNISSVATHRVQGEYDDILSLDDILSPDDKLSPVYGLYWVLYRHFPSVEFMENACYCVGCFTFIGLEPRERRL